MYGALVGTALNGIVHFLSTNLSNLKVQKYQLSEISRIFYVKSLMYELEVATQRLLLTLVPKGCILPLES